MSDIRELYQQVILDHNKNPSNFHEMKDATHKAEGYNPLCGDHYVIYFYLEKNIIKKISFQGSGCAISTSSASIMTELLKGKKVLEAHEVINHFYNMLRSTEATTPYEVDGNLGKAVVLAGVKEFPTRLKCATLAWHASQSALKNSNGSSKDDKTNDNNIPSVTIE